MEQRTAHWMGRRYSSRSLQTAKSVKMAKARPAWAMAMQRASRTWGSPERADF